LTGEIIIEFIRGAGFIIFYIIKIVSSGIIAIIILVFSNFNQYYTKFSTGLLLLIGERFNESKTLK
jgi:hypothetical protein